MPGWYPQLLIDLEKEWAHNANEAELIAFSTGYCRALDPQTKTNIALTVFGFR